MDARREFMPWVDTGNHQFNSLSHPTVDHNEGEHQCVSATARRYRVVESDLSYSVDVMDNSEDGNITLCIDE